MTAQPRIPVPSIALHGDDNGVVPAVTSEDAERFFTGPYERRVIVGVGHNLPQEAPEDFAAAVLALLSTVSTARAG